VEVRRQLTAGEGVEAFVVAFDEVHCSRKRFVTTLRIGDVAYAEPEGNISMPLHHAAHAVEVTVNIAERAELQRVRQA
jgi:hypothetical protein